MTEVSTRPRKGATTVTKPATAVATSRTVTPKSIENEGPTVEACLKAVRDRELDIAITDAQSGVREVIAILQSRLEDLNDGVACGARDLFQAADIIFDVALASQDVDDCERASCALNVAQCVLEVVTDKTDDLALWGCVRIAQASKDAIDMIVSDLMRADK